MGSGRFVMETPSSQPLSAATPTRLSWLGVDRNGKRWLGFDVATPTVLTERLYAAGWRTATISRDGETVGAVERNPDTGRRTWWAEGKRD